MEMLKADVKWVEEIEGNVDKKLEEFKTLL